jgi:transcriptional regulator with GAF, ATPase, and Fis domain
MSEDQTVPPPARRRRMPNEAAIRRALEATHGVLDHAARRLHVPRSTFQQWLSRPESAALAQLAAELRRAYAPPHQGRPFVVAENRSREAVARAWEASGFCLAVAARSLELPRTSLRHLLHRYGLPHRPSEGRPKPDGDGEP